MKALTCQGTRPLTPFPAVALVRINPEATFMQSPFEYRPKHALVLSLNNNYSNYSVKNAQQLERLLEAWHK